MPNEPTPRNKFETALNNHLDWIFDGCAPPSKKIKKEVAYFLVNPRTREEHDNYAERTARRIAKSHITTDARALTAEERKKVGYIYDKLLTAAQTTIADLYKDAVDDTGREFIEPVGTVEEEVRTWQARAKTGPASGTREDPPSVW